MANETTLARSNLKNVFGSGWGRISLILIGVIFLLMFTYGASRLFGSSNLPKESPGAAVNAVDIPPTDPMSPVSDEEAHKRVQANTANADDAQMRGQAFIAQPVVTQTSNVGSDQHRYRNGEEAPQTQPTVVQTQQPVQQQAQQQQNEEPQQQINQEIQKAAMDQVASVLASAKSQTSGGFRTYYTDYPQQQGGQQGTQQKQGGSPDHPGTLNQRANPIAAIGDTCFATLNNGINSDDTALVIATIHSCMFDGGERFNQAKVIGRLERQQDQVRVTFNRLRLPGVKTSIPIEAIAVTEDEARSGIGKDVDHHYFSRYFSLGLASLLSGYGRAAQAGSSTTVVTPTSTIISTEQMTSRRQNQIAIGEVGQTLGNELKKDFNRPATITSPAGMGIGVIFTNDVILER